MVGAKVQLKFGPVLNYSLFSPKKIKRLDQGKIKSSCARDNCEGVKTRFNTQEINT